MSREQEAWISQIRKGVVEVVILAMLARGEMYGSEIVAELGGRQELAISAGTIYPLLSRLKKAGLIDSVWRESPVGPPRKYYDLTSKGVTELRGMASAWQSVSRGVDDVLGAVTHDACH